MISNENIKKISGSIGIHSYIDPSTLSRTYSAFALLWNNRK